MSTMKYEEDNKTDADILDECLRILLKARGHNQGDDNMSRELVVSFPRGNYGKISSAIVEVNGSPTRGFACMIFRGSVREWNESYRDNMRKFRFNSPLVYVKYEGLRLVKLRRDSPKILALSRLISRSIEVLEKGKSAVVWEKSGDKLVHRSDWFARSVGDSGDSENCETQKKGGFDGHSTESGDSGDNAVTAR